MCVLLLYIYIYIYIYYVYVCIYIYIYNYNNISCGGQALLHPGQLRHRLHPAPPAHPDAPALAPLRQVGMSCAIHTHAMPKPICRACLNNTWVQYEACITSLGRGMGMHITAQGSPLRDGANRARNALGPIRASRLARNSVLLAHWVLTYRCL